MRPYLLRRVRLALVTAFLAFFPRGAHAVQINVTFIDGPQEGFNDPILGQARRRAFYAALSNWGGKLSGSVPITVSASMDPLGGTANQAILGQAHATYVSQLNGPGVYASTWYPGALVCELVGQDVQPGVPMITAQFNSDVDNATVLGSIGFYYGTDGKGGSDIDFYEVLLHELGHGLGFFSQLQPNGAYYNNAPNNLPSVYDQFLATGPGAADPRLVDLTQAQRAAALTSGSLYFNGPITRAANGGTNARIYAPSAYQQGSSTSHLDQLTYQNGPNALMCPVYSTVAHEAGSVGYAVFRDLPWPFTTDQAPVAINGPWTVTQDTATPINLIANDAENDPLTYEVVSDPGHGTVTSNNTAFRTYTPAPGYLGADSFTFRVNDGHWDSNIATISINVVPPAPIVSSFTPTSGGVGWTVVISGQHFGTNAGVTFNGVAATVQHPNTDTQIQCTVPSGATSGPIVVIGPGGSAASTTNFTVLTVPTGSTTYARDISLTSATLHATVNPKGMPTSVIFQYGPDANYGSSTDLIDIGSGTDPVDVTYSLQNLAPGTTYHYRAVAGNSIGTAPYGDSYFVTMQPMGGTALQFDGGGSNLTLPGFTASNPPTDEVTVEFWQNVSSVKDQFTFITMPDDGSNRMSGAVPWGDGLVYWDFGNLYATGRLVYTPPPDQPLTGHWEHWAFVSSAAGDFMKIYRNGNEVATKAGHGTFVPPATPHDLVFGLSYGGSVDELRVWNRARTADEIYHDMYRRLSGTEPGLVRLFHLDDGAGPYAVDPIAANPVAELRNNAVWVPSLAPIGYPTSITLPATGIGATTATLNGIGNANGPASVMRFAYGTTTTYGQIVEGANTYPETVDHPISATLSGLTPGTTYHYQVYVNNGVGVTYGRDVSFTTLSPYSFTDVRLALQCAAGLYTPTPAETLRWNVVHNGPVEQVDFADAEMIARKAAGLDTNP